jgi:hypothetical protein
MANMRKKLKKLGEDEIDDLVAAEADDDSAWERPIRVRRPKGANVPLPSELAARAAFFARLHHETGLAEWVQKIVHERVDLEEAAFAQLKKELATK